MCARTRTHRDEKALEESTEEELQAAWDAQWEATLAKMSDGVSKATAVRDAFGGCCFMHQPHRQD